MSLTDTLEQAKWGDKFYSITQNVTPPLGSQNRRVLTVEEMDRIGFAP